MSSSSSSGPLSVSSGLVHLQFKADASDTPTLAAAAEAVRHRLYVSLAGDWSTGGLAHANRRLSEIYNAVPGAVDVRVLLPRDWATEVPDDPSCLAPELDALLGPPTQEGLLGPLNSARAASSLGEVTFVRLDVGDDASEAEAKRQREPPEPDQEPPGLVQKPPGATKMGAGGRERSP